MATEDLSLRYQDLDAWPNSEILSALFEGQLSAVAAARAALPAISAAADAAVEKLRNGGWFLYCGAGPARRIGAAGRAGARPPLYWAGRQVGFPVAVRGGGPLADGAEGGEFA